MSEPSGPTATQPPAIEPPAAVIVLAAGEGTRMRSRARPKVLHAFAGRSMLEHVLVATAGLGASQTVVVLGHRRDEVAAHLAGIAPDARIAVQEEQRGTGHAVRLALDEVPADAHGPIVVVPGDAPLLTGDALAALLLAHGTSRASATLLTSVLAEPTGYGRVIRAADGSVSRVVEQKDATPDELAVAEIATSVYAFDHPLLRAAVGELSSDNAAGEEYLTDVIGLLTRSGRQVGAVVAPAEQTAGVNDQVQLAAARRAYNERLLAAHMRTGVTIHDPASTWIDADVRLDQDVIVHPAVELHGRTVLAEGAEIGPQVTLTDTLVGPGARVQRTVAIESEIGAGATVGPFAYLRPGTRLAPDVHIGTYVEVKNSDVGTATKVPHLSYVGDASIGEHSNIGAATVFVNYDGVDKRRSVVGDHVRTGADNMFVAPVRVGDGAYTAAGSVITQDVPAGALGVARARQRNVAGWVARTRAGTSAADAAARALGDADNGIDGSHEQAEDLEQ